MISVGTSSPWRSASVVGAGEELLAHLLEDAEVEGVGGVALGGERAEGERGEVGRLAHRERHGLGVLVGRAGEERDAVAGEEAFDHLARALTLGAGRVQQPERPHPLGVARRDLGRDPAAHRRAGEVERLQPQMIGEGDEGIGLPSHRVQPLPFGRVRIGLVAVAEAGKVGRDEAEAVAEAAREARPVVLARADPVDEQERGLLRLGVEVDDGEPAGEPNAAPLQPGLAAELDPGGADGEGGGVGQEREAHRTRGGAGTTGAPARERRQATNL